MFAYCLNNPVNRFDDEGTFLLPNWAKVTVGVVALVGAVTLTVATGGGAALKYLSSPANGIDTYSNLRKVNKGTGNQVHHIVEKRFADSLGINNTNNMLSVALSKSEHQVFTNAWRAALPYGNSYSKMQILGTAVKIYSKSPRLLVSAFKTIL